MFKVMTGNIFSYEFRDAMIVDPVNTVGVPGAGLAKQFAHHYPEETSYYKKMCASGLLTVGKLYVKGRVIFFPTKADWRNPSKLEYIDAGLKKLAWYCETKHIKMVVMPPLGCGLGGLDFQDVLQLMYKHLNILDTMCIVLR